MSAHRRAAAYVPVLAAALALITTGCGGGGAASKPTLAKGTRVAQFTGGGSEVTPKFTVPGNGDYTISYRWYTAAPYQQANFSLSSPGDSHVPPVSDPASNMGGSRITVSGDPGTHTLQVNTEAGWDITIVAGNTG